MDRAAAFEAEGRGFESLQARHLSPPRVSLQPSAVSYQPFFRPTTYDRSRQ